MEGNHKYIVKLIDLQHIASMYIISLIIKVQQDITAKTRKRLLQIHLNIWWQRHETIYINKLL